MHPLSKDEVDRILDNNLVDEFDRLAGTPGFVLVPMPFQKVQELARVGTLESLGQLGRHPGHIRTYRTFRKKDFPYYVQDGISHDNIWSTTPLTTQQLTQVMDDKLGPRRKYAYFVNPGPLASIPGV
ncbi:TPA: hypothetical protein ACH3X2_009167 [Trebouxia sp. C0005]